MSDRRRRRFRLIILVYPFALVAIGLVVNVVVFGVGPLAISLPSPDLVTTLVVSFILLAANHTWLMTSTELTRLKYDLHATPEEWRAKGLDPNSASEEGRRELERRHNAHRNATENMVLFIPAALLLSIITPTPLAAQVWIVGFAVGRLGHTYAYLSGRDGLRGLFMSLSLLSLYGCLTYLAVSLFI